jgi:Protein of unknown function (DUF1501)
MQNNMITLTHGQFSKVTTPIISQPVNRRQLLAAASGAGLSVCWPGPVQSASFKGITQAKSVIVVFLNGGASQLETFDPKPEAPLEIRGEFHSIKSAVPGTFVSEHLPRLARLADRYTIIRSMSHDDTDHGSATYLTLTGRYHSRKSSNPLPTADDIPSFAAAMKRVLGPARSIDNTVTINGPALTPQLPAPGQNAGLLGREFDPFLIGDLTGGPSTWPSFDLPVGLSPERLLVRRQMLTDFDRILAKTSQYKDFLELSGIQGRAFDLLENPAGRKAFDLSAEPDSIVNRYGRHRAGLACLLARRLVEAGVPLITVVWNHSGRGQDLLPDDPEAQGWDTHNDLFDVMKRYLLPRFDHTFSALLEDLENRGLLSQTLVLCLGEFGRAPRVALEPRFAGASPGRKHWANVYSMIAAGAGVKRGAILGSSDKFSAYPTSNRYGPWDVHATIAAALGVDPATEYYDRFARPFSLTLGQPITGLYS